MGEWLAVGDEAMALLANTIPTGAILVVIITIFGPPPENPIRVDSRNEAESAHHSMQW